MKHLIKYLTIVSFSFFLAACEKTVTDVDIPQQEQKLVVHAYISPEDTLIKVNVSVSYPLWTSTNYTNFDAINNAHVELFNNGSSVVLSFNNEKQAYTMSASQFPIIEGQNYTLKVSTPDGKKVESNCTVPVKNEQFFLISTDTLVDEWGGKKIRFKVKIIDLVGAGHYYRLGGTALSTYIENQTDTFYESIYPKNNGEYFTDQNADGAEFLSELNFWIDEYYMQTVKLTFYLLTIDVNYYHYHKSLSNYTGDNPFAEPTIIYSNIKDGLGVFGAYRKYELFVF